MTNVSMLIVMFVFSSLLGFKRSIFYSFNLVAGHDIFYLFYALSSSIVFPTFDKVYLFLCLVSSRKQNLRCLQSQSCNYTQSTISGPSDLDCTVQM